MSDRRPDTGVSRRRERPISAAAAYDTDSTSSGLTSCGSLAAAALVVIGGLVTSRPVAYVVVEDSSGCSLARVLVIRLPVPLP